MTTLLPDKSAPAHGFDGACRARVSYVLVTMNRSKYLADALERMRVLKMPGDELLVIDGGSTDDTAAVVSRFGELVDVFVSERDLGEAHAANKGYLLAHGRYVKEITDDDVIHPEGMSQAVAVMDANPDVELLVCGGTKLHAGAEQTIWLPPGTAYGRDAVDVFRYGTCGIGWLIRRSLFARIGLMNTKAVSLDKDFTAHAIHSGAQVRFCRINMYTHHVYDHSFTNTRRADMERDYNRILNAYTPLWFRLRHRARLGAGRAGKALGLRPIVAALRSRRSKPAVSDRAWDGGFS